VRPLPVIGWREGLALPALGVPHVKAKVDTGGRSSALHVVNLERTLKEGAEGDRSNLHRGGPSGSSSPPGRRPGG